MEIHEIPLDLTVGGGWQMSKGQIGRALAPIASVVFVGPGGERQTVGIDLDKEIFLTKLPTSAPSPDKSLVHQVADQMNAERSRLIHDSILVSDSLSVRVR